MATLPQIQLRCTGCNRRLGDLVNEVQAGQLILELKCPRCGHPHLEIIRPNLRPAESPTDGHVRASKEA
jgi:phage FluMu protein Com